MEAILVAALGIMCGLLGVVEAFRTKGKSLLAWASIFAGIAIFVIAT